MNIFIVPARQSRWTALKKFNIYGDDKMFGENLLDFADETQKTFEDNLFEGVEERPAIISPKGVKCTSKEVKIDGQVYTRYIDENDIEAISQHQAIKAAATYRIKKTQRPRRLCANKSRRLI